MPRRELRGASGSKTLEGETSFKRHADAARGERGVSGAATSSRRQGLPRRGEYPIRLRPVPDPRRDLPRDGVKDQVQVRVNLTVAPGAPRPSGGQPLARDTRICHPTKLAAYLPGLTCSALLLISTPAAATPDMIRLGYPGLPVVPSVAARQRPA